MATKPDYYDLLEVSRSASEEEIRKAFRRKALEYHPDRNKDPSATERFKEINEAYQVLTDPQKRRQYDRFGHAGVGAQAGAGRGFEGFDVFGGFGDIFDAFFGGGTASSRTAPRQGDDLQTELSLDFTEAVFGASKEISVERTEPCQRCHGIGSEPGTQPKTCSNCRGSGRVRRTHRNIFGQFVQEVPCNVCRGVGEIVTHPCTECRGTGHESRRRQIQVDVPQATSSSSCTWRPTPPSSAPATTSCMSCSWPFPRRPWGTIFRCPRWRGLPPFISPLAPSPAPSSG